MSGTQTESGKAWEYGLARQLERMLGQNVKFAVNSQKSQSIESYKRLDMAERRRIRAAARKAVQFLRIHDDRLDGARCIIMQSDMLGARGDVRDILIETVEETIGVSAKHRHAALKHSRLSEHLDFGQAWYGRECSTQYWKAVGAVFTRLERMKGVKWRELADKHEGVYMPILEAFMEEVRQNADPTRMMRYLLGRFDFYKVIKENGNITLQSFNMDGSLRWGEKIRMPDRIVEIDMKPKSRTTANLILNNGWQVSFRIHNASSRIEPSLKFDVGLEGSPETLSRHEIPY